MRGLCEHCKMLFYILLKGFTLLCAWLRTFSHFYKIICLFQKQKFGGKVSVELLPPYGKEERRRWRDTIRSTRYGFTLEHEKTLRICWKLDLVRDVVVWLTNRANERARRTSDVSVAPLRHKSNQAHTLYTKSSRNDDFSDKCSRYTC